MTSRYMEKAMAPHSSTLAWKIPRTEEPGGPQSMRSLRVGHDWATSLSLFTFMHWRRKWQPTPVFLPGESQGWEPGGLPSMGSHRVRHNWSDAAAAAADTWEITKRSGWMACLGCSRLNGNVNSAEGGKTALEEKWRMDTADASRSLSVLFTQD